MKKLAVIALLFTLLLCATVGCTPEDNDPNSLTYPKGAGEDFAPMALSSSFSFYISDSYLSDIGVTVDELFGEYSSNTFREVFDGVGFTGIELLAGYDDAEGMPGIFDLSSTRIGDLMNFQVTKTEEEEVEFTGEFSAVLPPDAVRVFLDVEFPTTISDYGGDAIQGSMLSEGVKASLDIKGTGDFHIRGN